MQRTPVVSSCVASVGYEEATNTMEVEFHKPPGSVYGYVDVPEGFWEEFMSSESKGRFVNLVIKSSRFSYYRGETFDRSMESA